MPEDLNVCTYDGRAYLNVVEKRYDVIMVDAYQDITIPFQMSSVEFFTMVREHLKDDGVLVVNMNMHGEKEGEINHYLSDTVAAVFPEVRTIDVPNSTNRELFASCNPEMLETMSRNSALCKDGEVRGLMERMSGNLTPWQAGEHLMTDDRAPVELLGMRVIDDLIRDEVSWYKWIYEEYGIQGIMDML